MRACGRALRVAAGPPLAVLRPLPMGPPWPAGRALPGAGLRPLIRRYKVEGALDVAERLIEIGDQIFHILKTHR